VTLSNLGTMIRAKTFWEQRQLHAVARVLLVLAVGVLVCVALGFAFSSGSFTRYDLLAVVFYMGLAAFAWHTLTASFIIMVIGSVGVVFTSSGGDLLELAIALGLVASTCVPWVIVVYATLLGALTAYVALDGSTLAAGGVYGIAGIAALAFLVGLAFRMVAAREAVLMADRTQAIDELETIARQDRERIADELHDGIAHDLTLILFHARALPMQPDEVGREVSLQTIKDYAEQAQQSIQSLLSLMRDVASESPLSSSARHADDVVETVSRLAGLLRDAGIPTQVSVPPATVDVAPAAERALSEAAIEAVTNIIKHAPKSEAVIIDVDSGPRDVELVVKNVASVNTSKLPSTSGGRGLKRAQQRLSQHDGRLHWGLAVDGWKVRARVRTGPELDPVPGPDPGIRD
jgi:signal transduction histidine kinase